MNVRIKYSHPGRAEHVSSCLRLTRAHLGCGGNLWQQNVSAKERGLHGLREYCIRIQYLAKGCKDCAFIKAKTLS